MPSIEDNLIQFFNAIGRLVCHQIPERSLYVGGSFLPVCSRDTGVYLGLYIGYLLLLMRRRDARGPPNLWVTLLMSLPMIVDATTQFIGLRMSTNAFRLLTGLFFGTALAPFLVYLLATIPLSLRLPILRKVLPEEVILDDKNSWLSSKSLGLGLLLATIIFLLINYVTGSTDPFFYWLLSPLIIVSIVLHILLLPIFLAITGLHYLRRRFKHKDKLR